MTATDDRPPEFLDEDKALACVHCGLCLGACPTYLETGLENESPRGRIYLMRALQDGRLPVDHASVRHIDLCLGCRACEPACPSGVQYGTLLEQTRDFLEANHARSIPQRMLRRWVIEKIFPEPGRMRLALLPARFAKALGLERWLPAPLRASLALVPDRITAPGLPAFSPADTQPARGRVGFISGCVMSVLFAETNRASVRLLNRAGYDVVVPGSQTCCGALFAHSGQLNEARARARRNIESFAAAKVDTIVINAAGCGSTLKEYGHLLHGDPDWESRAEGFSARVADLSEFLLRAGFRPTASPAAARVTYHDACHLAHPQRITRPPRDLVKAVAGSNYVELSEADVCCGSAGSYNLTEPAMAHRLQQRKLAHILATKAEIVVTTNPGCLLQIQAGLKSAGRTDIRALHLADYLAAQLPP